MTFGAEAQGCGVYYDAACRSASITLADVPFAIEDRRWSTDRCMNQLLFARSAGSLAPQAFARQQTTQLIHAVQAFPKLRFDGGEQEVVSEDEGTQTVDVGSRKLWAHKAGVNALALDVDNKM